MKKIYIAMAVLATVALTSCEQEQSFDDFTPLGENDIAFYIPGPNSTRAEVVNEGTESGQRIEVGTDDNGIASDAKRPVAINPYQLQGRIPGRIGQAAAVGKGLRSFSAL